MPRTLRTCSESRRILSPMFATSRCMCRRVMCRELRLHLLWARMDPTDCFLRRWMRLIAEHKLPPIVAISIQNGGSDAQGSERGLEYDTMSGKYAEFVENEVLPAAGEPRECEADARSRWAGDDWQQLGRIVRSRDGVVPPGVVSPRADVLGHVREPAVAVESRDAAWGVGISRDADSATARASRSASGWKWAIAIC